MERLAAMPSILRRAVTLLALAARAVPASAFMAAAQRWETNASGLWRPEQIALRGGFVSAVWDLPAHRSSAGLGSGISYAWDPQLCDSFLPKFGERQALWFTFIDCDDLVRANPRRSSGAAALRASDGCARDGSRTFGSRRSARRWSAPSLRGRPTTRSCAFTT
jgi:hypothetical protein